MRLKYSEIVIIIILIFTGLLGALLAIVSGVLACAHNFPLYIGVTPIVFGTSSLPLFIFFDFEYEYVHFSLIKSTFSLVFGVMYLVLGIMATNLVSAFLIVTSVMFLINTIFGFFYSQYSFNC